MDLPDHHCPGCGKALKSYTRYPWYFCNDCVGLCTDGDGRRLNFGNAGIGGGFLWGYAEGGDPTACGHVRALIKGRVVLVTEARFGGIVAQPTHADPYGEEPYDLVDLSKPTQTRG